MFPAANPLIQQPFGMSRQQNQQQQQQQPTQVVNNQFQQIKQQPFVPSNNQQQQQQSMLGGLGMQQQQQGQAVIGSSSSSSSECEVVFSGKHDALYIYLARLMAPIWNQSLLVDLASSSSSSDLASAAIQQHAFSNGGMTGEETANIFATFNEISVQWYLNKVALFFI
jgi:hypothetical protein